MRLTNLLDRLERQRDHHAELKTRAPVHTVLTWVIEDLRRIDGEGQGREFLDTAEAADRLGVTRRTVQNWARDGRFPGADKTSTEGVWCIPAKEVRAALNADAEDGEEIEKLWEPDDE